MKEVEQKIEKITKILENFIHEQLELKLAHQIFPNQTHIK